MDEFEYLKKLLQQENEDNFKKDEIEKFRNLFDFLEGTEEITEENYVFEFSELLPEEIDEEDEIIEFPEA